MLNPYGLQRWLYPEKVILQRMLSSRVMTSLVRSGRRSLATSTKKAASYSVQDEEDFKARVLASQVHKRIIL